MVERVAVVGSRRFSSKQRVVDYVNSLPDGAVVVSGGARGVDSWAEEAARVRGLVVVVHEPDRTNWGRVGYREMCERYYARNLKIVMDSDRVVAFVMPDRRGGTENTIRHAVRLGKPVEVIQD